jgi:hypothetical protein
MRVCCIALACPRSTDIDIGYEQSPLGNDEERKGGCIGMQYAATRPSYLLDGLIAKSELRELLDILYDELEAGPIGLLA